MNAPGSTPNPAVPVLSAAEEAARIAAESEAAARAEAERIAEVARLAREEAERIENELAAQAEAELLAQEVAVQFTEPEPELEPEPVAAAGFATGPALAAVLIAWIDAYNTFYVIGVFALLSGVLAMAIRVHEKYEEHDESEGKGFLHFATQGFRILFKTPSVLILMIAFLSLSMIYLPTEMVILPRYFSEIEDPTGLGIIISAMAVTTSISSLFFEWFAKKLSFSSIMRISLLGVAGTVVAMSFLPPFWLLLTVGFALGVFWGPLGPLLNTVIQRKVPANMRGRVFSLEMTIWTGGPMISMVIAGAALDWFGVQPVYFAVAGLTLLAAVLVSVNKRVPELNTAEFQD